MDNFSVVGSFMLANSKENLNIDGCGTLAERILAWTKCELLIIWSLCWLVTSKDLMLEFCEMLFEQVPCWILFVRARLWTENHSNKFLRTLYITWRRVNLLVVAAMCCNSCMTKHGKQKWMLLFPLTLWIWIHVQMWTRFRMCACWVLLTRSTFIC